MNDTTATTTVDVPINQIGSLPELQYLVLSAMSMYLSDADVKSSYYGTRFTFKMRNGQTAEITIDVSNEDKQASNS